MYSALFGNVRLMRKLRGGVASKINVFSVQLDGRLKPAAMNGHPKKAACVALLGGPLVLHVHGCGDAPEVVDPVIGFVSVDVVNVAIRPNSMHIKPSQPVRTVNPSGDMDVDIATVSLAACRASFGGAPSPPMREPREKARVLVIRKKFSQALRGNSCVGHESLQWSRHFTLNPCVSIEYV